MEEAAQHLRERPDSPNDEMLVAMASARRIIDETSLLNKLNAEDPVGFGSFMAHIPSLRLALQAERDRLSPGLHDNRESQPLSSPILPDSQSKTQLHTARIDQLCRRL